MRKHSSETTEYFPEQSSGTYQTGSTRPPKRNRGFIAVLMITIIFLGGLASVLGLTNVHLLVRLAEANRLENHASLSVNPEPGTTAADNGEDMQEPSIPGNAQLDLPLAEPLLHHASDQQILDKNEDSLVTVCCVDTDSAVLELVGVIIHEDGYILTNAQPLVNANRIDVFLSDGRCCRAALVGYDPFTDLAVLYIDADGLTAAEFVSSRELSPGDAIAAISSPDALDHGSVRHNNGALPIGSDTLGLMRTDLGQINGPVFNHNGQIAGFGSPFLNSCFASKDEGVAVSSITIKETVEQLVQTNCVPGRPCLGVSLEEVQSLYQRYWRLPGGLRVSGVEPGSMAEKEGLQVGDIITAMNCQPISDWESLYAVLWHLCPGDRVELTVFRDGNTYPVTLTIQEIKP